MTSLSAPVDAEDWLGEDLPVAVDRLAVSVPATVGPDSWAVGYSSVASDVEVDPPESDRVRAAAGDDGEYDDELVEISGIPVDLHI